MKNILLAKVFILFSCCVAVAEVSIDDLSKSVVYLCQQTKPNTVIVSTGFIVKYENNDYLVTAKHVAESLSPTAEIILNLKSGKGISIVFRDILQNNTIKGAHWFTHPNPNIDISIHPIIYLNNNVDIIAVPESVYQKNDNYVKLLNKVCIIGFPLGLGGQDMISPIAKEAKVASRLTTLDVPEIPKSNYYYLLDEALSGGYSGAPVFYIEDIISDSKVDDVYLKGGEKLHLLGIQSGVLSDKTGGKMSLVIPSMYLWDIFSSSDFQKYKKGLRK